MGERDGGERWGREMGERDGGERWGREVGERRGKEGEKENTGKSDFDMKFAFIKTSK